MTSIDKAVTRAYAKFWLRREGIFEKGAWCRGRINGALLKY